MRLTWTSSDLPVLCTVKAGTHNQLKAYFSDGALWEGPRRLGHLSFRRDEMIGNQTRDEHQLGCSLDTAPVLRSACAASLLRR